MSSRPVSTSIFSPFCTSWVVFDPYFYIELSKLMYGSLTTHNVQSGGIVFELLLHENSESTNMAVFE